MQRLLVLSVLIFATACGGGGSDGATTTPPTPPVAVSSVSVSLGAAQLFPGGTTTASAETRSAAGAVLTGRALTWNSSTTTVATIDASGAITAIAAGTTIISATSEGQRGTATLTVNPAPVATINVALAQSTVVIGTPTTATATLRDDRGVTLSGRAVSWTSSTPSVATIDAAGAIATLSPGVASIMATSEGKSGIASLVVIPPPVSSVSVALTQSVVAPGKSTSATVTLRDVNGAVLTGRAVTWMSSAASIATIDAAGTISAIAIGSATISATAEGKSGSAVLAVQLPPVATITISGSTTVAPGGFTNLSATLKDAAGATLTDRAVTWATSNSSVATVSTAGVVSGVSPGAVTISATSEGKTGSAALTVKYAITSVTFTGSARVKVGDAYTYSTTARLADGTVVSRPIVWNVKESGRGTITAIGVLTPLQTGTLTLQALIDGDVWESTYTVYNWETFASGGALFASLDADNTIIGRLGVAEYPRLIVSCGATGYFFVWVRTNSFITQNGLVALSFDGATPFSQLWDELSPEFKTLWKPGTNGTIKLFAQQIAASRQFGFAFTEYLGSATAMIFRVTGLAPLLTPLLAQCTSNAIVASAAATSASADLFAPSGIVSSELAQVRLRRANSPPSEKVVPVLPSRMAPDKTERQAVRRNR